MDRKDCFAYVSSQRTHCKVLYTLNCEKCKFYKTQEQFDADAAKYSSKTFKKLPDMEDIANE